MVAAAPTCCIANGDMHRIRIITVDQVWKGGVSTINAPRPRAVVAGVWQCLRTAHIVCARTHHVSYT